MDLTVSSDMEKGGSSNVKYIAGEDNGELQSPYMIRLYLKQCDAVEIVSFAMIPKAIGKIARYQLHGIRRTIIRWKSANRAANL